MSIRERYKYLSDCSATWYDKKNKIEIDFNAQIPALAPMQACQAFQTLFKYEQGSKGRDSKEFYMIDFKFNLVEKDKFDNE